MIERIKYYKDQTELYGEDYDGELILSISELKRFIKESEEKGCEAVRIKTEGPEYELNIYLAGCIVELEDLEGYKQRVKNREAYIELRGGSYIANAFARRQRELNVKVIIHHNEIMTKAISELNGE